MCLIKALDSGNSLLQIRNLRSSHSSLGLGYCGPWLTQMTVRPPARLASFRSFGESPIGARYSVYSLVEPLVSRGSTVYIYDEILISL